MAATHNEVVHLDLSKEDCTLANLLEDAAVAQDVPKVEGVNLIKLVLGSDRLERKLHALKAEIKLNGFSRVAPAGPFIAYISIADRSRAFGLKLLNLAHQDYELAIFREENESSRCTNGTALCTSSLDGG